MKKWGILLLVLTFLLWMAFPVTAYPEPKKPELSYEDIQYSKEVMKNVNPGLTNQKIADAIFTEINKIRADNGLSALTRNAKLDTVAQGFSDSMASTLTYPWNGPHNAGGNNWLGTGGRMKSIVSMGFAYPAENIMRVSGTETSFGCDNAPTSVEKTSSSIAVYTVLSWVEHDGCANNAHRKTVLSDPANYGGTTEFLPTDVGIGVAKGSDGQYYITADFAHKN